MMIPRSFKKVSKVFQESSIRAFRKMDGCFNGVGFKVVGLPGIEPCRAIPLEQLTKCASFRNCSKGMELRLGF